MKFKTKNKGQVVQRFGGNFDVYKERNQLGHSGVDTVKGWNALIVSDNAGYVYKTIHSHQSSENWQGVYILVPVTEDTAIEVCQGHFNEILVKEGQTIPEGAVIGKEGNKGFVRSGGVPITPEMQKAGDKRGAHTHTSYRPVLKVKKTSRTEYYLTDNQGKNFKDKDGFYYQIIHKDNGYKGCVDPFNYLDEDDNSEKLSLLKGLLNWLLRR